MVVSGLPKRNKNHIIHIVNMALELRHFVTHHRIAHRPEKRLRIRIGLHSGPCAAGLRYTFTAGHVIKQRQM